MTLLGLFLILIAIGVGLYFLGTVKEIDHTMVTVIRIVALVIAVGLVLNFFGVGPSLGTGCNHRLQ